MLPCTSKEASRAGVGARVAGMAGKEAATCLMAEAGSRLDAPPLRGVAFLYLPQGGQLPGSRRLPQRTCTARDGHTCPRRTYRPRSLGTPLALLPKPATISRHPPAFPPPRPTCHDLCEPAKDGGQLDVLAAAVGAGRQRVLQCAGPAPRDRHCSASCRGNANGAGGQPAGCAAGCRCIRTRVSLHIDASGRNQPANRELTQTAARA